jgi:transcriptional regulator with XRE-family HTH domain
MARKTTAQLPALKRLLKELGENIKMARLRRNLSARLVSERAGMSRTTLRGLENDIALIARDDELGRKLQDAGLPTKARASKKSP